VLPFRLRHADQIVGVFLLVVVLAVVVTLIAIMRSQDLFKRRVEYRTVFEDGGGIRPETPVKISGIEVGKVRSVRLNDANKVEVVFDLLEDYVDRLVEDPPGVDCTHAVDKPECGSRVAASVPAGLGAFLPTGGGLVINVGHRKNPLVKPGGLVLSEKPTSFADVIERLQQEGFVQNAKDIVDQVAVLLRRVNDVEGPIWRSVRNVETVTERAKDGKGFVGEALAPGSPMQVSIKSSLDRLERSLGSIEQSAQNMAQATDDVRARKAEIDAFLTSLSAFAQDAKTVGTRLTVFADEAQKIPPEVREAVKNLDRRIDDLGAILKGLKNTFPFNMGGDEKTPEAPSPQPAPSAPREPAKEQRKEAPLPPADVAPAR